jgi:alkylation response protein AidB-like acyl-CoA dehydrogenase
MKPLPTDSSPIDTSNMPSERRAAIELTEAAREQPSGRSFVADLFMGRCDVASLFPFPEQPPEDEARGDAFLSDLESIIARADPGEIDRTGEIPPHIIDSLAGAGAFAIKIPREYGGLGLSQTNYCRAAMLLGGYCGNLTALISAHQSIGVPQPLLLFGTEEQRKRFLPRFARGELSAFALTETGVGSDPARMETHAEPIENGAAFLLNGEKLWCTNGTRAGLIVVMARTPALPENSRVKNPITAFIVEASWPGVEVVHRCRFMGLRALYNGVIRFHNVRVPRENILLGEGKGLRVALSTLNTGRLTLPAACVGLSRRCLDIATRWARTRRQWGAPIGQHGAVAGKLARMAADTFAMESMTLYAARLIDRDKHADIRLEAALTKLWATEATSRIVDDTLQVRGGRGFETEESLRARGEEPEPVERFYRDTRINTIFEGSSEIMRLFVAREALDPHLRAAGKVLDSRLSRRARGVALLKSACFYFGWYPGLFAPRHLRGGGQDPCLRIHMKRMESACRRLARELFHGMVRYGPGLEAQQLLLGRCVDIAAELFAIAATCARADAMMKKGNNVLAIAECACVGSELRIEELFRGLKKNSDRRNYALAAELLRQVPGCVAWRPIVPDVASQAKAA